MTGWESASLSHSFSVVRWVYQKAWATPEYVRARRSVVDHPPGTGKAPGSNPGESMPLFPDGGFLASRRLAVGTPARKNLGKNDLDVSLTSFARVRRTALAFARADAPPVHSEGGNREYRLVYPVSLTQQSSQNSSSRSITSISSLAPCPTTVSHATSR